MTQDEILVLLSDVVSDIVGNDGIELTADTKAADVRGWDSLAEIGVLAAAEQRFGVRIRTAEAARLRTMGELADLILAKAPRIAA